MLGATWIVSTMHPYNVIALGAVLGFPLGLIVMRLYDNYWEYIWRVPMCSPGACYCRQGCPFMLMDAPE